MQSNDIELAGWLLSSETLHELETLDMSKLSYDKMNVFYIHRQELAVDRKLLQSLELSAKTVEVRTSVEFSGFSQDALFGVEPVQDFQAITQWVASKPCEATEFVSHTELASTFENTLRGEGFLEQPLFFGRGVSMFGVLCIPEKHEYQFCVVFVSTGANHRIGSQRLTVDLARRLASQGISSFRIDISGVGDSQTRAGCKPNQVYFLPAYEDVVQAVDAMTERGYTDVIVSGMCSGAYLGYNAAVNDPRIKILFILNLFRFIWRDSDVFTNGDNIASAASLESYGQKLFRWSTWRRFLKGRVNIKYLLRAITNRLIQKIKSRFLTLLYRVFSPGRGANAVERDCVMMLRRGTHINLVFSADDAGMDEVAFYLGDRGHVLRRYPGFSFRDVPGADHTFTTKQSRSALVEIYMDCIRKYQRK
jgi:hypothetical protein